MDKTLKLFKLFHYLKEVTTKSYSLKKLQDILERRLNDESNPIRDEEYNLFLEQFDEVYTKLKLALKDVDDLNK
jgi:hypothetical protein